MHNKLKLTVDITLAAFEKIQAHLDESSTDFSSVSEWLEHELNNNTDVIIEMLLGDF